MEMKEDGEAGGGGGMRGVAGGVVGDTSRGSERSANTVNYGAVIIAQAFRLTSFVFSRNHCQFSPVGNHQYITRPHSKMYTFASWVGDQCLDYFIGYNYFRTVDISQKHDTVV